MMLKEYLQVFSNQGEITVKVKFSDPSISIAAQRMSADEVASLVDPATGLFISEMRFDDHVRQVRKFEIDLQKNTVTIHVKD